MTPAALRALLRLRGPRRRDLPRARGTTRVAMMHSYYPMIDDPRLKLCLSGTCDCSGAAACAFRRCRNCDLPVGDDGRTLTDWCGSGEVYEDRICPDCGAVVSNV